MARHGICVNCVCPGPTVTPLFAAQPERMREALLRVIPFRRLGTPQDLANAILFFASPRSSYVTGQVLSVRGEICRASRRERVCQDVEISGVAVTLYTNTTRT